MSANKIVIHVDGGVVQGVWSDGELGVRIIDEDDLRESHTRDDREAVLEEATAGMKEVSCG